MKLERAMKILNRDRLAYLKYFTQTQTGVERAGSMSSWVEFRTSGCPDVSDEELKALRAVRRYMDARIEQFTEELTRDVDSMGQIYTC
jgi:hypothetical protein